MTAIIAIMRGEKIIGTYSKQWGAVDQKALIFYIYSYLNLFYFLKNKCKFKYLCIKMKVQLLPDTVIQEHSHALVFYIFQDHTSNLRHIQRHIYTSINNCLFLNIVTEFRCNLLSASRQLNQKIFIDRKHFQAPKAFLKLVTVFSVHCNSMNLFIFVARHF